LILARKENIGWGGGRETKSSSPWTTSKARRGGGRKKKRERRPYHLHRERGEEREVRDSPPRSEATKKKKKRERKGFRDCAIDVGSGKKAGLQVARRKKNREMRGPIYFSVGRKGRGKEKRTEKPTKGGGIVGWKMKRKRIVGGEGSYPQTTVSRTKEKKPAHTFPESLLFGKKQYTKGGGVLPW